MEYKAMDHGVNIVTIQKNMHLYAMTCAWAMQVDYDKIILLIGAQSQTGQQIQEGDVLGVSILNQEQIKVAVKVGETHSTEIEKLQGIATMNLNGAIVLTDSNRVLRVKVSQILHLEGIETDKLIYATITEGQELRQKPFLHMSDF
ncbi:MAG: flavin reductase [Prevotella sp.]|nr:flavin reductase [Staphylococcus sp.]MCM1349826.1 flavin reductase [Prevotella sp.]